MSQAARFPRWLIDDRSADHRTATDREESSSRSVMEAAVYVSASTDGDAYSSEDVRNANPADRLHQDGCDWGDADFGLIELQKNDGPASASVTSSPMVASDANTDNLEIVTITPSTSPMAFAVRRLVVKFECDKNTELLDLPHLIEENPRRISHPGNSIGNLGNAAKNSSCDFVSHTVRDSPVVASCHLDEANTSGCHRVVINIGLRILYLIIYYLLLWGITVALTYLLLELSLLHTSKDKYPYYMSPHSYCITSPAIGFAGCDAEPGKVTTFENLTKIGEKIDAALGKLARSGRDCDAPAGGGGSLSEGALRIPCNMTRFVDAMGEKAREVLADRPALLVQIRRHLGYLPAKAPAVTVKCRASLSLSYFSWNGTRIVESPTSGSVPTGYFPMLTRQHDVPSVLVAIGNASKDAWWSGKEVTVKCIPSDGGSQQAAEKTIILLVKA